MSKEIEKPIAYPISKRLVLKAIGEADEILRFIEDIQKVYPGHCMNFSPVQKNKDTPGYHCFINLLMPLSDIKKEFNLDFKEIKEP
jgi:pyruvate-formate lyase-activating enzyme